MWQVLSEITIGERAKHGCCQKDYKNCISCPEEHEHHSRAYTGEGPAHAKNNTTNNIPWPGAVFVIELLIDALDSFYFASSKKLRNN